jgi:hypothetical protein
MDTQINKVFFTFSIVMSSDVFIAHGYSNLQCFFSHFYIVMSSDVLQEMVLAICVESTKSSPFFVTNVTPSPIKHELRFVFIFNALHQFQILASLNMFSNELGH